MEELSKLADSLREISARSRAIYRDPADQRSHRSQADPDLRSTRRTGNCPRRGSINVGKFLVQHGITAQRWRSLMNRALRKPLDDRADEIAYRRNRRIGIKRPT